MEKIEEITEYKVYRIKPYVNSNKEPFGITIQGKSKEYVAAHQTLKRIIIKGKKYKMNVGEMKVLDITDKGSLFVAIIQVSDEKEKRGNVELKVHAPGKKGASIELRKMSDYDYIHVEWLKVIITTILDGFIDGEDINEVTKRNGNGTLRKSKVTSKPTLFSCNICNFQSRFASGLKGHKTRIHKEDVKCTQCDFEAIDKTTLETHIESIHKADEVKICLNTANTDQEFSIHTDSKHEEKNAPSTIFKCDKCKFLTDTEQVLQIHIVSKHEQETIFECVKCGFGTNSEDKLGIHKTNVHKQANKRASSVSPSSSPPRKKIEKDEEIEENEVEMIDLEIEANDVVNSMLENRIKQLEKQIERDIVYKRILQEEITKLKEELKKGQELKSRPNCVSKVQERHLPLLRGFKWRFKATPDGACLTNCFAVHAYEDEDEGLKVKRMVNNYIADNWEYFKEKISLPYVENVGVGRNSKVVTKNTKEEMIQFLRSDESLAVFANCQELVAIANCFNITINIFTYGGIEDSWSKITPDPAIVKDDAPNYIPDMNLYHSFDSHYDLLVKDDSRVAVLGPLAGIVEKKHDDLGANKTDENEGWNLVKNTKNKKSKRRSVESEELLVEKENENGCIEETALLESKKSGYRRECPQEDSHNSGNRADIFNCSKCECKFKSKELLETHMKIHTETKFTCDECEVTFLKKKFLENHMRDSHDLAVNGELKQKESVSQINISCDLCALKFINEKDLKTHNEEVHEKAKKPEQWNCNDCPFQANCVSELMNHLKLMGHAPSKAENDNRQTFKDFRQCYTCRREFDGYWNLMTHIKNVHPSKRKCRNFPGNCKWGSTCWFVHREDMEIDQADVSVNKTPTPPVFDCKMCDKTFKNKNEFIKHKKTEHKDSIEQEQNEKVSNLSNEQVFQQVSPNPFPPDQMSRMFWMMTNLMRKVDGMERKVVGMEKRFEEIMI